MVLWYLPLLKQRSGPGCAKNFVGGTSAPENRNFPHKTFPCHNPPPPVCMAFRLSECGLARREVEKLVNPRPAGLQQQRLAKQNSPQLSSLITIGFLHFRGRARARARHTYECRGPGAHLRGLGVDDMPSALDSEPRGPATAVGWLVSVPNAVKLGVPRLKNG